VHIRPFAVIGLAVLGTLALTALNWLIALAGQLCLGDGPGDSVCEHLSSPSVVVPDIVLCLAVPLLALGGVVWAAISKRWLPVVIVWIGVPVSIGLWGLWDLLLP
jgi:hypothetical protein